MNGCNAMLKWKNPGNPVNQRKLHTVHTLIFAKSTKVAHGRKRATSKANYLEINLPVYCLHLRPHTHL